MNFGKEESEDNERDRQVANNRVRFDETPALLLHIYLPNESAKFQESIEVKLSFHVCLVYEKNTYVG